MQKYDDPEEPEVDDNKDDGLGFNDETEEDESTTPELEED
jgi:hypothetical protein